MLLKDALEEGKNELYLAMTRKEVEGQEQEEEKEPSPVEMCIIRGFGTLEALDEFIARGEAFSNHEEKEFLEKLREDVVVLERASSNESGFVIFYFIF